VARNTTVITSSAAGMQVKNSAGVTTSTSSSAHAAEEAKAQLAERVLLLTNAVQSYVAAEAQCIQFLAQRVVTAQTKQAVARKELLAYAALMMKVIFFCSCFFLSAFAILEGIFRNFISSFYTYSLLESNFPLFSI